MTEHMHRKQEGDGGKSPSVFVSPNGTSTKTPVDIQAGPRISATARQTVLVRRAVYAKNDRQSPMLGLPYTTTFESVIACRRSSLSPAV